MDRVVILTKETIGNLVRDYLGDQLPKDAKVSTIMVNPQEQGKLALVMESPSIKAGQAPSVVHFDIRRMY